MPLIFEKSVSTLWILDYTSHYLDKIKRFLLGWCLPRPTPLGFIIENVSLHRKGEDSVDKAHCITSYKRHQLVAVLVLPRPPHHAHIRTLSILKPVANNILFHL